VNGSPGHERGEFVQPGCDGVGVGVGVAVGVGVGVVDGPPQMIDESTKKSPASAPLAWAVAESSVSLLGVVKPVPLSGVWVPLCVNGPEYVTVPAFLNVAVIETNVGRGLSPPAGSTKCQPTMPEQSLVAFLVDALPGIVVDADTIRDDKAPTATRHAAPMMRAPTGLRSRVFIAFPLLLR
jgi:hypothetical protein